MIELRFNAIRSNGQIVSGGMSAPTYKEGKTQIQKLVEKHKLKLKSIKKKATFVYKIKKGMQICNVSCYTVI